MAEEEKEVRINRRQQVFIDEYLKCFNGSEAARRAGYSEKSARQTASDLLAIPYISEQIQSRLDEVHMSADEALKLTADIARGDIGELLDNNGLLDIRLAKNNGKTKLLRKIKQKTVTRIGKTDDDDDVEVTEIEFEMYPADSALEKILKVHGKFTDRVDVTSGGEKIEPKVDNERFDRAISALADALRDSLSGTGAKPNGEMGTTK